MQTREYNINVLQFQVGLNNYLEIVWEKNVTEKGM